MEVALVASGFGSDGGGLFRLTAQGFERVDHLQTTGLAVSPDGTRLARALRGEPDAQSSGRLLLYDRRGLVWLRRHDELIDAHGIAWTSDDEFVQISTGTNAALWIEAEDGRVVRRWTIPGDLDAAHLNCPAVLTDGRVVATAFGRFRTHCEWRPHVRAKRSTGLILALESDETLAHGIAAPHDPVALPGGGFFVCESARGAVVELDARGRELRRTEVGGWTRGLIVEGDRVYVGISQHRHAGDRGTAAVAVLDRATLTELARWDLPTEEVFALAWASEALLAGVARGAGLTDAELGREVSAVRVDLPLPADALGASVAVTPALPSVAAPGSWLRREFALHNAGDGLLSSDGTMPVLVGARWAKGDTFAPDQGRARLRHALLPGERTSGTLYIPVPDEPGEYRLTVAALQESVVWFDHDDPSRGVSQDVTVG